jgi:hypothetical protein
LATIFFCSRFSFFEPLRGSSSWKEAKTTFKGKGEGKKIESESWELSVLLSFCLSVSFPVFFSVGVWLLKRKKLEGFWRFSLGHGVDTCGWVYVSVWVCECRWVCVSVCECDCECVTVCVWLCVWVWLCVCDCVCVFYFFLFCFLMRCHAWTYA